MPLHNDLLPLLFQYYFYTEESPLLRAARRFMTHEPAWRACIEQMSEMNPENYQDLLALMPKLEDVIPRRIVRPTGYQTVVFGDASVILFHNGASLYNPASQKSMNVDRKSSILFSRNSIYMLLKTSDGVFVHGVETLVQHKSCGKVDFVFAAVNDHGEVAHATGQDARNNNGEFTVHVADQEVTVENLVKLIDGSNGSFMAVTWRSIVVINRVGDREREVRFPAWDIVLNAKWVGDGLVVTNDRTRKTIYDETLRHHYSARDDRTYLKNKKLLRISERYNIDRIMKNMIIVRSSNLTSLFSMPI